MATIHFSNGFNYPQILVNQACTTKLCGKRQAQDDRRIFTVKANKYQQRLGKQENV
jgi:hypothetical protein